MGALRSEVRYQRVGERPEEEDAEVTVRLYSHSPIKEQQREACARIFSSVLLLVVAGGFILYDLHFGNSDPPIAQQRFLVHHEESNNNLLENPSPLSSDGDTEEDHHHHHQEEDDEDEKENSAPSHHHSAGTYPHAVAVTDSETCSILARDVLQSGGSVVDAGITAVFCLVVVHPHTSSLGGVFSSVLLESSSQKASVLNAVPEEASPIQYGIPQVLQGLWLLHQNYGRTSWSHLVSPATISADGGFLVDSSLRAALEAHQDTIVSSEALCSLFCKADRSLLDIGERVTNPALATVLGQISSMESGLPDDFVQRLVNDIEVTDREKFSSAISRSRLTVEEPVTLSLDGLTLHTTGGTTAGRILSTVIEEISNETKTLSLGSASAVLLSSAKKAYTEGGAWPRGWSSNHSSQNLPPWSAAPVGSNVIMANSQGDIFALSLTLNSTFGSGFLPPSMGFLLSDFVQGRGSSQGSALQYWACPSILVSQEGDSVMGLLASGGSSVPFSLAQVVIGHLLLDKDLSESVNRSLVDVPPQSSDPWLGYLGLQGKETGLVVVVEVEAEHVHVVKSHGPGSYPVGL